MNLKSKLIKFLFKKEVQEINQCAESIRKSICEFDNLIYFTRSFSGSKIRIIELKDFKNQLIEIEKFEKIKHVDFRIELLQFHVENCQKFINQTDFESNVKKVTAINNKYNLIEK